MKTYEVSYLLMDGSVESKRGAHAGLIEFESHSYQAWSKMAEILVSKIKKLKDKKRLLVLVFFSEYDGKNWIMIDNPSIRRGFQALLDEVRELHFKRTGRGTVRKLVPRKNPSKNLAVCGKILLEKLKGQPAGKNKFTGVSGVNQ